MSLTYVDASSNQATKSNPTGLGLASLGEFSVCGWVNMTTLVNTRVLMQGTGTSGAIIQMRLSGATGNFSIAQNAAVTLNIITSNTPLAATGTWAFIAAAIKVGTEGHIYKGDLVTPATECTYGTYTIGTGPPTAETGTLEFCLGNGPTTDNSAPSCKIGGPWQVYNRLVSLAEFKIIQDCGQIQGTGCKGSWRPGDNGGASVTDLSGVGNTLTITGATVSANPQGSFITRSGLVLGASANYLTDGITFGYRYFKPSPSALALQNWGMPYRVLFNWHGSGENGTDNSAQMNGSGSIAQLLGFSTPSTASPTWPVLSVFPQQPVQHTGTDPDWASPGTVYASRVRFMMEDMILADLQSLHSIDTTRIYGAGLSLGGRRMFDFAYERPTRYAAIIPCAANIDSTFSNVVPGIVPPTATDAAAAAIVVPRIIGIPIKMYNSSADVSMPPAEYQAALDAYAAAGLAAGTFWTNTGGDHVNAWTVPNTALVNPAGSTLQTWLFAQQRAATSSGMGVMRRRRRRLT